MEDEILTLNDYIWFYDNAMSKEIYIYTYTYICIYIHIYFNCRNHNPWDYVLSDLAREENLKMMVSIAILIVFLCLFISITCAILCAWEDQRTGFRSWLFPSTLCVPRIKFSHRVYMEVFLSHLVLQPFLNNHSGLILIKNYLDYCSMNSNWS